MKFKDFQARYFQGLEFRRKKFKYFQVLPRTHGNPVFGLALFRIHVVLERDSRVLELEDRVLDTSLLFGCFSQLRSVCCGLIFYAYFLSAVAGSTRLRNDLSVVCGICTHLLSIQRASC